MKKLLLIFFLLSSSLGLSQTNNESLFNSGVDLYNQGKYLEAISQFELVIENGEHSYALYFNLGNSFYKINDIANSIFYYEKALKLNPNEKDVINNLSYSQNMLIDKIDKLPVNQVSQFVSSLSNTLSINQWLFFGITFLYLFLATFFLYYFNNNTRAKKNYFTISTFFLVLFTIFLFIGINRFENEKNIISAIIFKNKIDFRAEPNYRSDILFNLHEGTKVIVKEELNDWILIQISDGNSGWIESESIKKID
tara:strand:- start:5694 stop:6452 length:759 start_codon:yes stop_codon:yes gene_type:complete